jgi:hypothetical protein
MKEPIKGSRSMAIFTCSPEKIQRCFSIEFIPMYGILGLRRKEATAIWTVDLETLAADIPARQT